MPKGTTAIQLTLDRVQAIGVRTAVAEDAEASAKLRVTAVVAAEEQGLSEVHVRSPGFVQSVFADRTGIEVQGGQPMLTVYSPELLQAQEELLATSKGVDAGESWSSSARRKLELLGMPASEIASVVETQRVHYATNVVAPARGVVTKKNVVLGAYVTPETALYELSDLSHVTIVAEVFVADLPSLHVGAEAQFFANSRENEPIRGRIDQILPSVTAESRTRRVRMRVANDSKRPYVPGDYGVVEFAATAQRRVTIPRDALVDTGGAKYVFVVEGEGVFSPRAVTVETTAGDRIAIADGLQKGERVVSGATFLIDSESRLQASMADVTHALITDAGAP
jgi:Cu(I)/Ag(I) efflux system membrane fusion protein